MASVTAVTVFFTILMAVAMLVVLVSAGVLARLLVSQRRALRAGSRAMVEAGHVAVAAMRVTPRRWARVIGH